MDNAFLKEQALRCRSLAEIADKFTKRRLLDLAESYEARLGRPSRGSRALEIPANLLEARLLEARLQRPPAPNHPFAGGDLPPPRYGPS
jgi:hypothetical protein